MKYSVLFCLLFTALTFGQENSEVEKSEIPFAVIENVPVFPGCKGTDNSILKNCMSEKISTFVNLHFNRKILESLNLSEGTYRIFTNFKIDKEGYVVDVKARAPKPEMEQEAIRVVSMLPQLKPGKQKGRPVGVLYALPMVFKVEGPVETKKEKRDRLKREKNSKKN